MSIKQKIREKLEKEFSPIHLEIIDESHKHAGHAGMGDNPIETHIGIIIASEKFTGLTRLERSRTVHSAIAEEIKQFHALTMLKTLTPEEYSGI